MKKTIIDQIADLTGKFDTMNPGVRPRDAITIFGGELPNRPVYINKKPRLQIDDAKVIYILIVVLMAMLITGTMILTRQIGWVQSNLEEHILSEPAQVIAAPTVEVTQAVYPATVSSAESSEPVYESRTFKITAYCNCVICCHKTDGITYSGAHVQEGITCAADLSVLPLGSVVDIEGIGIRTVQDKGKDVKGDHIDVYMIDHQTALAFGVQYRTVKILEVGK